MVIVQLEKRTETGETGQGNIALPLEKTAGASASKNADGTYFCDFASIAEADLGLLQPCFSIFLFVVFASLFRGKNCYWIAGWEGRG